MGIDEKDIDFGSKERNAIRTSFSSLGIQGFFVNKILIDRLDQHIEVEKIIERTPFEVDPVHWRRLVGEHVRLISPNEDVFSGTIQRDWRAINRNENLSKDIFIGNLEDLVQDTQVVVMINSFLFVSTLPNDRADAAYRDEIFQIREPLRALAQEVVGKSWENLAEVTVKYFASPLVHQVQKVVEHWSNQNDFRHWYEGYNYKDDLQAAYGILKNPSAFMREARTVYKEAYGLDLDEVKPIDSYSEEGLAYHRQKQARFDEAKAVLPPPAEEDTTMHQTTAGERTGSLKDVSKWFLDDGRVNKIDGLTNEDLIELAKQEEINIPGNPESMPEGKLRREIAQALLWKWFTKGEEGKLKSDSSPLYLMFGRYHEGFGGFSPGGGLNFLLMEYSGDEGIKGKPRIINEIYERYWEPFEEKE